MDLREEHFLPVSSEGAQFIRQYREMFGKSTHFLELVIDQPIEYHDHAVSSAISEILDSAVVRQTIGRGHDSGGGIRQQGRQLVERV